MTVLDASAAVDLLLGNEPRAGWVADQLRHHARHLHAPSLLDVEVTSALRSLCSQQLLKTRRAEEALLDLVDLPVTRHHHLALVPGMWRLRETIATGDSAYVALAELLETPLVTTDRRLARSHGHGATIDGFGAD